MPIWEKHEEFVRNNKPASSYHTDFDSKDFNGAVYLWPGHATWRVTDYRERPGNSYGGEVTYGEDGRGVWTQDEILHAAQLLAQKQFDQLTHQERLF